MSDRGQLPGEGPTACPFVAFEDDRDRRSVEPDHRHRCYAEVRPAPRALAHQSAYCLTASFPACPTFVDWARREAAQAVRSSGAPAPATAPSGMARSDVAGDDSHPTAADEPVAEDEDEGGFIDDLPPRHPRRRDWAEPPRWLASDAAGGQLRAFEDEAPAPSTGGNAAPEPTPGPLAADESMPERRPPDEDEEPKLAPAPAFLAGRADAAEGRAGSRGSGAGPGPTRFRDLGPRERASRRDEEQFDERELAGQARRQPPRDRRRPVVDRDAPSWEAPRRYEAYPTLRTRVGLPRIPPLGIALIAVLVAAALLFVLPSIFGGGGPGPLLPSATSQPSATDGASVAPTGPSSPTPQTYVVRPGDTLIRIADQFGLTVDQMMAANPQLEDPDSIRIDDVLTIPPPGAPGTSPSGTVSPAP